MEYAANTKRLLRFVFRAVRHFVVKRAKALGPMAICIRAHIRYRKTENFCQWMKHFRHARSLRGKTGGVNPRSSAIKFLWGVHPIHFSASKGYVFAINANSNK
jgi:AMMECR1 domain-containing protein